MTIQIIQSPEQLARCQTQWNDAAGNNPLQSWEWCANWLFHFEPTASPFVVYESDSDGRWTGLAPMALFKTKFGENKLAVMGSGSTCTDYTNLIANEDSFARFTTEFSHTLSALNSPPPSQRIEIVEFDGMELHSPKTEMLIHELESVGYRVHTLPVENCWRLKLENSWNELNSQFSKKHRRKTKKATHRLHSDEISVQYASRGNFEPLWDQFVRLHQKRREMVGQDGCFSRPRFESFLQAAVDGLLQRDLAELIQISINDEPFASTLLFHDCQTAFMYQTGFDPKFQSLEPGYMLIVQAMNWAIDTGLSQFDFMRGDEPYKARWNAQPVPMGKLRFADATCLGSRFRDLLWQENTRLRANASAIKSRLFG